MNGLLIGVDGGGTKTRVIVSDDTGAEIASFEGEGSAVRPDDIARSADVIAAAVRSALADISEHGLNVRALCVGVAGVGRQTERDALATLLVAKSIAEEVFVEADASVAMEDAFGEGAGILLIAGTGSIAFGRGPTGTFARCGGWGPNCGDEGGGYWLGRRALSAVTAAADGREPETALTGAILTAVQANHVNDLIAWAATAEVHQIAALARSVMQTATVGDLRADALVTLAAEELVLHVRTLARWLFSDERAAMNLALTGGLLEQDSLLRKRIELRIKTAIPGAHLNQGEVSAARGALKMARRLLAVGAG